MAGSIWLLGALGLLPRVKRSTKGEGHERRYFYGSVWAVCIAQPMLWLMWRVLPRTRRADALKLVIFVGILALGRQHGAPRPAAADAADRARRARRLGLRSWMERAIDGR